MSKSLTVVPPNGFPDIKEPIVSMGYSPYSIRGLCVALFATDLVDIAYISLDDKMVTLIEELDKENGGMFSDDYFWQNSTRISEYDDEFLVLLSKRTNNTKKELYGQMERSRARVDAARFMLYAMAGYRLVWED